jgi:hypothetical protein
VSHNIQIVSKHPIGYGYREFADCDSPVPLPKLVSRIIRRVSRIIPGLDAQVSKATVADGLPSLCLDRWNGAIERFAHRLAPIWSQVDYLIVNGEGTIHHDSIGARNLIGLCVAGKKLGMHVSILNCSIYELSEPLLSSLRQSVDQIVVREPNSFRYLAEQKVPATLSADCLFLASSLHQTLACELPTLAKELLQNDGKVALYTPGVLSGSGQVAESFVTADIQSLVSGGYNVIYYVVEAEDEHFAAAAQSAGASIMPLGSLGWKEVFNFLKFVSLVVSGRYHINIFAAIAGVQFIPMETNTSKMNGLLELVDKQGGGRIREFGVHLDSPDFGENFGVCTSLDVIENLEKKVSMVTNNIFPKFGASA